MKRYTKVRLAAALVALNTLFSAPLAMAAYNVNQAKLPQVKEASAYNYVLTKAESGKRSEIVDYKNYCDDILFFEDELRNGSLKGLIDDFDYILPEELSYSYFGFHAFKDGEETSYIFDLSSSALGSYALTHDFQMDLHEVTNAMREGKLNKSNFNMCYKTSDLARYLYNLSKDKVEEKINSDLNIQNYLKDGYKMFIVPSLYIPSVRFDTTEYNKNQKPTIVTIDTGNVVLQLGKQNNEYVFLIFNKYDILLTKANNTIIYSYGLSNRYRVNDNDKTIKRFLDGLSSPKQFISFNSIREVKKEDLSNGISIKTSSDLTKVIDSNNLNIIKDKIGELNLLNQVFVKDNVTLPYNYFNYSLGRLDDATYEKYIGEEMGK